MKKIKGPFCSPSTRPSVTTRAGALVVRVEHWTPKGATKKEHYLGDLFFFKVHFLTQKNDYHTFKKDVYCSICLNPPAPFIPLIKRDFQKVLFSDLQNQPATVEF